MSSIVRTVTLMFTAREPGTDGPATSGVVSDTQEKVVVRSDDPGYGSGHRIAL